MDYQQLKFGQFRKNLKIFNIKTATQEVINIFKHQADSVGIDLKVIYQNILDQNQDTIDGYGNLIVADK